MKPILRYYDLHPDVTAFSTTRRGGVSQGNYSQLNINGYCGDDEAHVAENRTLLAAELGIATERLFLPHQVHGVEVRALKDDFLRLDTEEQRRMLEGVDAVMTDVAGICIGVSTADCIPVLLYDPTHRAAAAIHAGWRGTVARIVQHTVRQMALVYGTDPRDLLAVVGPGISLDAFEVGDEVYEEFEQAGFDMTVLAERLKKWHINLPLCNQLQLVEQGVPAANIQQSGICTYSHPDEYFSARRLGIKSGRIFTGIQIKKEQC